MTTIDIVNLKRIQRIKVTDRIHFGTVKYTAPRKRFFGWYTKGYYSLRTYDKYDSFGELIKDYSLNLFLGDEAYYKAEVYIEFVNKETIRKTFDTYEEALAYGRNVADNSPEILFELK